ncbi:lactate utilization protein [Abyssisolibacter fermentans]|uniref:lactate utilization protein n=1 Tax=Abyssisolibacter fermentans TaxID=1766203 RepID=UPI000836FE64|nr:lactate utilization protein [Abyssisolibacter fermentans]
MNENVGFVYEKMAERTIENLKKGNINGYFLQDEKEAIETIESIVKEGATVSVGGSMTLFETGILDYLRNGKYKFLDRYQEGLSKEDIKEIYRKTFFADAYFTSVNALTEQGEIYNVDGNGNRVAATLYGPDKVIFIVGINKLVSEMKYAVERNENLAAPANAKRLNKQTPCTKTGICMNCLSKERICRKYVVIKGDMDKDRMHVIIINKNLGY